MKDQPVTKERADALFRVLNTYQMELERNQIRTEHSEKVFLVRWRNFFRLLLLYHFWKLRGSSPFPFLPVSNDENLDDS